MATLGLLGGHRALAADRELLFGTTGDADLVAAAFVGLWAGMNYEQLTSLFRVEERSVAFVSASLANILHHDRRDARSSSSRSTRARSASSSATSPAR